MHECSYTTVCVEIVGKLTGTSVEGRAPGIELRSPVLATSTFYPLCQLAGLIFFFNVLSLGSGVTVQLSRQPDEIWSYLGDEPLGMPMRN